MNSRSTRSTLAVAIALGLAAAAILASLAIGARPIALGAVWEALTGHGVGNDAAVVLLQRVPRTLIGAAAGAALAVAGTLMQGLTRNPMADPGLLGVNAGASLAVLVAISAFGIAAPAGFIWFAFVGAAGAAVLVYLIGMGGSPAKLTLAGAAVAAGLGSVALGLLTTSTTALSAYRFWSVGSLTGRELPVVWAVLPFILAGLALAVACGRRLDIMALGDDVAAGLGHSVPLTRGLVITATVLLAGSATALAGPLVFIGLVVPHVLRGLGIVRHTHLIALAAPAGAALLLLADVAGRIVAGPGELEAGFVVALIGAPVLIAVVRRRQAVRL